MAAEIKGIYIPGKVLADTSLGAQQKLVLALMLAEADDDNICRLSSQEIGDRLAVTKATAALARKALCQTGWLRRMPKTVRNYKILRIRRKPKND